MNKADLVDRIASTAAISKTQATAIIETFIGSVSSAAEVFQHRNIKRLASSIGLTYSPHCSCP